MRPTGFKGPDGNFRRAPAEKFIRRPLVNVGCLPRNFANKRTRVPPLSPPPSLPPSLPPLSLSLSARIPARATVLAADLNDPFHNARLLQTYKRSLQTRRLRRGRLRNFGGGASREPRPGILRGGEIYRRNRPGGLLKSVNRPCHLVYTKGRDAYWCRGRPAIDNL